MKRSTSLALIILVQLMLIAVVSFAAITVSPPHYDEGTGLVCSTCHTAQLTIDKISTGYNNICQNCHRPGDPAAGGKSITLADAANPFGSHSTTGISKMHQTSHRWDGSTTNPAAGAQPPVHAQMTTSGLLSRTGGQLSCVNCHNQHSNANGNFLRIANDRDQMCLDCHRSRDTQAQDFKGGSHPVGVQYDGTKAGFKVINSNSTNPSADLNNYMNNATVSCSTCHGVHFTDSRSSTPDGRANFTNLSSGDGNLLRTDRRGVKVTAGLVDNANLCTICHTGKTNHNKNGQDVQCVDCHGAHVENYPASDGKINVNLIRRDVDKRVSSTNPGTGRIFFRYTSASKREYKNAESTGVCQGCHAVPASQSEHSSNDPKTCNVCHTHNSTSGSFSGSCNTCHGYPPITGSHTLHVGSGVGGQGMKCQDCHGIKTASNHNNSLVNWELSGSAADGQYKGSASGNTGAPMTSASYGTCSNIACHANPYTSILTTVSTPVWGTASGCSACHTVAIGVSGPATGSHAKHAISDCSKCHAGATNYTTTPTANHTDGSINATNGYPVTTKHAADTGYTGSCSTASCHEPYSTGTTTTPVWGATGSGCAACHNGANVLTVNGPATGSHIKHSTTDCSMCHDGATNNTTTPTANHANGSINATNGYPLTTKHAANSGYTGTCSTAACHGNPYADNSPVTTPVWGANSTSGCAACHNGSGAFTGIGDGPATGSHNRHLAIAGSGCGQCHAGAKALESGGDNHSKNDVYNFGGVGVIDVTNGYPASVAKHTTASGFSGRTCSAATCHANVYGSGTVTTPVWGSTATCNACHTTPIGVNGPATGSHTAHAGSACISCHNAGTTVTSAPTTGHVDGNIDVTSGYPASVAKHTTASGFSGRTCSAATCHADVYGSGIVTTPVWGTAASCSACHTTPIGITGPATGSHVKHNKTDCSLCHAGATNNTTLPAANHADGDIDVTGGYPPNVAKHTTASGFNGRTCSTATCHANVYGAGIVTTPAWGSTASCSACHATAIGVYGPATGSHNVHAISDCSKCHAGATNNTTTPTANHADGSINATNGYPVTAKHAVNTGYVGKCSTSACHGQGAPTWGASAASPVNGFPFSSNQCEKCHGSATSNPFYSTAIPKETSNINSKVGAHTAHITASESLHPGLGCNDCHGTVSLNDTTHMNGVTSFSWSALAKTGNLSPSYDPATGKCSNVYCHGAAMAGGDASGTGRTPVWTDSSYLPPTLTVEGCKKCHGFPPLTNSHLGVSIPAGFPETANIGTTCSCHSNVDSTNNIPAGNSFNNMFVDKTKHINGTNEGGACNACHGYPPVRNGFAGAGKQNNWSSASLENYSGGGGAHTINGHVSKTALHNDGFAFCNKCHSPSDHRTNPNVFLPSQNIKVKINQRYRMDNTSQASYTSNRLDGGLHVPGTCSNISCHYGATPVWNQQ